MAIQKRLYVLKGPSNKELQQFVDASASAAQRFRTAVIEVQYDDSVPLIVETLDAYMDTQWGLDNGQPGKEPGVINGLVTGYVSATTVSIDSVVLRVMHSSAGEHPAIAASLSRTAALSGTCVVRR